MATFRWDSEALAAYGRIATNGGMLHERLDQALDLLEDGATPVAVINFRDERGHPIQGVHVRSYTDEILLLWQQIAKDIILIAYIGPPIAGLR